MSALKNQWVCLLVALLLLSGLRVAPVRAQAVAATKVEPRPYLYEPSLSPDRKEIAFVSGGDVWTAPAEGGEARLLVSHPATESRPLYSPDGRQLAFVSTRTGNGVYRVAAAGGTPMPVSADRYANEWAAAPSPDGAALALVGRGYVQWWRH